MRILMLTQFYPPVIGGEERHVRNLSLELVARGHQVAVATLWQEGCPEFEEDQGVRVYRFRTTTQRFSSLYSDPRRTHVPPFPDPEAVRALSRIMHQERPEIVHAHNWLVYSFLPLKQQYGCPLILTLHDFSQVCPTRRFLFQRELCEGPRLDKCLQCSAQHYGIMKGISVALMHRIASATARQGVDLFLPVSRAVAEGARLSELELPFQVIPNFIPDTVTSLCSSNAKLNRLLQQLPRREFLLFVGDVGYDKGITTLLNAYADMACNVPLVLIGRAVADSPTELPPGVIWLRDWPHQAVMHAWRRCAIGVVPSLCPDACPTVAMEAMAMGKPVVASRIGGISDVVVDGKTGVLVPPGNARILRFVLEWLMENDHLRARMGEHGRQQVTSFLASAVVSRIETIYREVIQSS
ncbi:glycosyltransferase involved in cell wall biosynthesis [Thermosporothrix hazakensis]|jgi:glycosyltransferase involved in cell wall biosynthesis|uniref:Glycosyltransferase involved in cell wall biosynthesis n=2 Tax=Thermosporothrix TaxID=768650 RepID=A0A326TZF8_THEHA|nr:glycosyltransferase family 4 protein [Thermosporothrix hazakensis]PZW22948.1 glycosyltransferase involved in cell wall biosynthesis [Thermosporothrix hazakensis]BBH90040.1 hypothetical protein KTC_47910 [Thermosporothrix sp. COM3]GCE48261.1 hypothetical protein KTH_31300 [Thermosporothrix hazakensis]